MIFALTTPFSLPRFFTSNRFFSFLWMGRSVYFSAYLKMWILFYFYALLIYTNHLFFLTLTCASVFKPIISGQCLPFIIFFLSSIDFWLTLNIPYVLLYQFCFCCLCGHKKTVLNIRNNTFVNSCAMLLHYPTQICTTALAFVVT